MSKKVIYMAVTPDEYELPMFVGNMKEISAWAGIAENTIRQAISANRTGRKSGRKFVRTEMDNVITKQVELRDIETDEIVCIYDSIEQAGIDMYVDPAYLRRLFKKSNIAIVRESKFVLI